MAKRSGTWARGVRAAAICSALALAACGKQTFLAAAFLQTPALPDPTHPGQLLGPYAVLTGYLGTIDISDPTKLQNAKIAGVGGAKAKIIYQSKIGNDDRVIDVTDRGDGKYLLESRSEPRLTFEPDVTYTLIFEAPDEEAYGARFKPGAPAHMVEFSNKTALKQQARGIGLTVTRDDPAGADGRVSPALILVFQVDPQNLSAEPRITYFSIPQDAMSILKLALSDEPYRKRSFDIPGSAFPNAGYFVVTMLAVQQGKVSSNAFLGSTALAGTGDAGLVQVQ